MIALARRAARRVECVDERPREVKAHAPVAADRDGEGDRTSIPAPLARTKAMYSPNDDVELCGGEMSDSFPSGVLDSALGGAPASTGTRATFELSVGPFAGRALDVVSFVGREAISKLFAFDILVVANEGEDLLDRALIGLPATARPR